MERKVYFYIYKGFQWNYKTERNMLKQMKIEMCLKIFIKNYKNRFYKL
jgi:hypothetical protein